MTDEYENATISVKIDLLRKRNVYLHIQGAGSPQKKVERIKPARMQPARCIR